MHEIYNFLTGPMAYFTFIIFVGGVTLKILYFIFLSKDKDPEVINYYNPFFAIRSILAWSIPFVSHSWRKDIIFTMATFFLHISIFLVPIFLSAHMVLINLSWGISYATFSNTLSDLFTIFGMISAIYLFLRRIIDKKIRYLSTFQDYFIILLVFFTLFSAFMAYHQFINYKFFICLHILLGEILIILIPVTKLSHMIIGPIMRGYMGSEFGMVRNSKDW